MSVSHEFGNPGPLPIQSGEAMLQLHGEDRVLNMPEAGVFGVFDGLGSLHRSADAAQLAADTIRNDSTLLPQNHPLSADRVEAVQWIEHKMTDASSAIKSHLGNEGSTTAAAVRLVENSFGGYDAAWASVGDSRIYCIGDDSIWQVTEDEGRMHFVYNSLGADFTGVKPTGSGSIRCKPGDRLLLVTDGVTGDVEPDLRTLEELKQAVEGLTPDDAAQALIRIGTKKDDRTALVVDIPESQANQSLAFPADDLGAETSIRRHRHGVRNRARSFLTDVFRRNEVKVDFDSTSATEPTLTADELRQGPLGLIDDASDSFTEPVYAGERHQQDRRKKPTRKEKRLAEQAELRRKQLKAEAEAAKGKYGLKTTDIRDHFDDNGLPLPMTQRTQENLGFKDEDALSDRNDQERTIAWSSDTMHRFFSEGAGSEWSQKTLNANKFNVEALSGYNVVDVSPTYMEPFGGDVILAQGYVNRRLYPIKTNHFQRGTGNTVAGYKTDETYELNMYSARVIAPKPGEYGRQKIDPESIKPLDVPLPSVRWIIHPDEDGQVRASAAAQENAKQISIYTNLLKDQISDRERAELIALHAPKKSKESRHDAGDPVDVAMRNLIETAQILEYLRNSGQER